MEPQHAEMIAISALQYLASNEEHLSRFAALSGADLADIRSQASEPGFLAGILDYFVNHEPSLLEFAANANLQPEAVVTAKMVLEHGNQAQEEWL